jgi:hypothetical protein
VLPTTLTVGADQAFVVVEVAARRVLVVTALCDRFRAPAVRPVASTLTVLLMLANADLPARMIPARGERTPTQFTAATLGRSAIDICATNVTMVALWYWLLDRGVPRCTSARIGRCPASRSRR